MGRMGVVKRVIARVGKVGSEEGRRRTVARALGTWQALIKNSACLRVALLQHLFIHVLPLPLPLHHPKRESCCFWTSEPMLRESQTQLLRLITLLAQHYVRLRASCCPTLYALSPLPFPLRSPILFPSPPLPYALSPLTLICHYSALLSSLPCCEYPLSTHPFVLALLIFPCPLRLPCPSSSRPWPTASRPLLLSFPRPSTTFPSILHPPSPPLLQAVALLRLHLTRELDASRIVTFACMATTADAILRKATTTTPSPSIPTPSTPSVLSQHYAGRVQGPVHSFGIDHELFAR